MRQRRQEGQEKSGGKTGIGKPDIGRGQSAAAGIEVHRPHAAQQCGYDHESGEDKSGDAKPERLVRQADPFEHCDEAEAGSEGGEGEAEAAVDSRPGETGVSVLLRHGRSKERRLPGAARQPRIMDVLRRLKKMIATSKGERLSMPRNRISRKIREII